MLDLRPIAVIIGCGFNKLLICLYPGYMGSFNNVCYVFFETAVQHYEEKQKLQESLSIRDVAVTTDI